MACYLDYLKKDSAFRYRVKVAKISDIGKFCVNQAQAR